MSFTRFAIIAAVVGISLLGHADPAAAQSVRVEFRNGRVTLNAQNAPVRTILAEWARVGQTKIINGERVGGAPLTLELTNVPERQALDIILRNVSGYMAGPRPAAVAVSASSFDRIMILPTSAPAVASAQPRPGPVQPVQTFTPPPPQIDPDDPEENPPADQQPNVPTDGRGGRPVPRVFQPPRRANGVNGAGATQPFPPQTQPDPDDVPQDAPAPAANPFGIAPGVGSARPGVITPVPQQPQPNQRPNGDPEP